MAQRRPVLISGKLDYFAGIKDAYRPALFYRAPVCNASTRFAASASFAARDPASQPAEISSAIPGCRRAWG
jgi:hypothetical protein